MHSCVARVAAPFLAICIGSALVSAQRKPAAPPARFTQLDCRLTTSAAATWDTSGPHVRRRKDPALEFRIGNIDSTRESADFMLGALTVPTLMNVNNSTFTFIEPPESGEIAIISVVVTNGATRFRASYSRTAYYAYNGPGFTSTPQAEQYYGYCSAGRR